jgi:protein-S-isoprenylcysteine O-methyltransferase Ste14
VITLNSADQVTLVRAYCLFAPVAAVLMLWLRARPDRRAGAAVLLACVWQLPSLVALHLLADHFGWWAYEAEGGLFLGFPVDLYLGWVTTWGALPALVSLVWPRVALWQVVVGAIGLDVLAMPLASSVLRLSETWLLGEAVGVALCLVPAQLLARWTAAATHLAARATLQAVCFSLFFLGLLTSVILEATGQSAAWQALLARPAWQLGGAVQVLALPAALGLSAAQEFATRGGGTPLPYDPPSKLVTSGPYAYVANPMQLAMALLFICWGLLLGSGWVVAAAVVCGAYSQGIANWDEQNDLPQRFGAP